MWPGQQPPGGEQNPQDQNPYQQPGYQQPNPYQQPGYQQTGYPQPGQQPAPYGPQPGQPQWGSPAPAGAPQPPSGGGNRTKVIAITAATAVVVAAGVTGFLVLGGNKKDDNAGKDASTSPSASATTSPSASGSGDNPRGTDEEKPTIAGWKVVINPKWGTAFDVPPDWNVRTPGTFIGFDDEQKNDGSAYIGMSAPAFLKEKWCTSDDDKDGRTDDTALAAAGTKGESGAKDTDTIARGDSAAWAFGGYTDQAKASEKLLKIGKPQPYTTASGIKGSVATSYTVGVPKKGKCDSDGTATSFGFKNSAGDFVSWSFYGAKGVSDEVPDATVRKILSTVRLHGTPTGS